MVIDATGVGKTYSIGLFQRSSVVALSNVSFSLHPGEILAVVGPSGAGKTTLLRTIMNDVPPSRGLILRFGNVLVPPNWECVTGYSPEAMTVGGRITGRHFLTSAARAHGRTERLVDNDVFTVLDAFGLASVADTPCWAYSQGIRARLSLAQAFVHRPRLIALDNPTRGLDLFGRCRLKHILEGRRDEGCAILLTSCEFTDVESVADRILVLQHGIVTAQGKPRDLFPADTAFTVQVNCDPLLSPGWKFMRNGEGWYSMVAGRPQLELLLRALTCRGITSAAVAPVQCAAQSLFSNHS